MSNKLQPRSTPCIFLGYAESQYGYLCLDPTSQKIYTSRHVQFFDHIFPYPTLSQTSPNLPLEIPQPVIPLHTTIPITPLNPTPYPTPIDHSVTAEGESLASLPAPGNDTSSLSSNQNISSSSNNDTPTLPSVVSHSMTTRSQNNIFKPKRMFTFIASKHPLPENMEPSSIREAMKHEHWRKAIGEEFEALIKNGTWSLVPPKLGQNIVGCKWLFRIKRNSDGSISRYKARLVAKGFTQCPGIDFKETFAPVVRPQTIKVILTLALSKSWPMHQLDVNNAFLQGALQEDVFMAQPPGLKDSEHPNYVCKLHKAIYGLRQAARAWHDALKQFILSYGFHTSRSDPSLFLYTSGDIVAYFLVYVDDLLLKGNQSQFLQQFITALSQRFSLKNMGAPHYFLGIEFIPTSSGLFLSQHNYIREILERFNMEGAKPSPTPLSSTSKLQLHDGTPATDATEYRSMIGALQYLNLTRPDLSFAINKLSQFMHKPTSLHLQHLKRIMRYIKFTMNHGLLFRKAHSNSLLAYSDADWGGNHDDRTSTSAYIIFFGGNPISWLSRKQRTVARSSTEAEYRAVATATTELMWLQNLLHELQVPMNETPRLLCDNVGATYLCSNPVLHSKMKHISLDYHFVRERVQAKQLLVSHVSTKDQLADVFTKPLATSQFNDLTSKIKVADGTFILRGRIE